jgi:hypothetical protein
MSTPQLVPLGKLPLSVQTGVPDVQSIAAVWHAVEDVQVAPAVQLPASDASLSTSAPTSAMPSASDVDPASSIPASGIVDPVSGIIEPVSGIIVPVSIIIDASDIDVASGTFPVSGSDPPSGTTLPQPLHMP